ncbi:GNAT family N-acetyltransferase [Vallitalea sp.]|jgi:phosphinothricin acetyltransferase|uniref:GNAT family N-acetyltransferase n=1 Tax=Vallitalea sp. TaxID=1882829 RepID=UPI0025E074BB|nr:GNAT family N-acetyltransferase [Vallitalea sp.]MCT4688100.1 GNAT family N-acetyltransferase [Vallitalea sp.]
MIRDVKLSDAQAICNIYNYYVENTIVTFEEENVTVEDMTDKIKYITDKYCFIVYEDKGKVVGYAYVSKWRGRSAYRFCVESSIYLDKDYNGRGIGTILYKELIDRLQKLNYRVIMGVVALPNEPSVKLHEKIGFKKAGHFEKVGLKFNRWIDVGYWQYNIK